MMEQGIACADCGTAILGSSSSDDPSNRAKCSKCGSSARTIPLNVQDTFAVGQMLKMRQKRLGNSRFIKQIEVGDSLFRSTNEWRKLSRVIDRPNDRYHEGVQPVIRAVSEVDRA